MSTKRAREVINQFLSNNDPEVLALKGRWGTGKSYAWIQLVTAASSMKCLGKSKYAYVSLFGINSLTQLKDVIFEQTLDSDLIHHGPTLETLRKNVSLMFQGAKEDSNKSHSYKHFWGKAKKFIPYFEQLPFIKDYFPLFRSASFLSVRDMIICFDDFERKGDSLEAKDILGLISLLKEQRNCKVAIILNDESLYGEAEKEYQKYREKVVDIEINFLPTSEECSKLVFSDMTPESEIAKHDVIKLSIKNIRILQKLKRLINGILVELKSYEKEVADQVIHTLILMGWSFYSREGDAPPLDFIKNIGFSRFELGDDKDKLSDKEKSWTALLRDYGYNATDDLDLELVKYIERGFYEKELLHEKLSKLNDQIIRNKSGDSYMETWQLFHNSFDDNETELIQTIKDRVKVNAKYLSPHKLNGSVKLLRKLGYEQLADELIEFYISENKYRSRIFSLKDQPLVGEIDDEKIINKFSEIASSVCEIRTLEEVIKKITDKDGWGSDDEELLTNASTEQYYAFFKAEKSEHLSSYIDRCLAFGRYTNASEQYKRIAQNAREALERIGRESKLNALRVKKYGIELNNTSNDPESPPNY